MTRYLLAVAGAFLFGGIPAGYVVARVLRGIDIRAHGSGNIGATNVFRVVGRGPGMLVLVCDVLKGALPVLAARLSGFPPVWMIVCGLAAILGHTWSVFLGGRGGKGVATGFGAVLSLFPAAALGSLLVWTAVFVASHYVSAASISAAFILPVLVWLNGGDRILVAAAVFLFVLITYSHRANIRRLRTGTENRVSFPWERSRQS